MFTNRCPRCGEGAETSYHVLAECPAFAAARMLVLNVMTLEDGQRLEPKMVVEFLRETRLDAFADILAWVLLRGFPAWRVRSCGTKISILKVEVVVLCCWMPLGSNYNRLEQVADISFSPDVVVVVVVVAAPWNPAPKTRTLCWKTERSMQVRCHLSFTSL